MKTIFTFIFFVCCVTIAAQTPDTLVKLGGKKVLVYVKNIGATDVYYSTIEKPKEPLQISRKNLEKVIFKSGRVEKFSDAPVKIIDEGDWQAVIVTKDKKDVAGLYKRKEINAKTLSSEKARDNTLIKMKKQTANAGGTYVLITKEETQGTYGELPGCYMEGVAYGTEPVEEGTNVIKDSIKK